jgi:LPXTG-site transpeptidase (sortase) family protein
VDAVARAHAVTAARGPLTGRPAEAAGRHRRPAGRPLRWIRPALALVAVVGGAVALLSGTDDRSAAPTRPAAAESPAQAPPAPIELTPTTPATTAVPVRVQIPAIGVDSGLVDLGVDATGALLPPADFSTAGWFAAGTVPGEIGPAVLAGHVDDYTGPAVFYRLEDLTAGDQVVVTRTDGRTVTFTVDRVASYPKDDFATTEVYGPTADAQLRLITCGGTFDRSRRSYVDNVVVYANAT